MHVTHLTTVGFAELKLLATQLMAYNTVLQLIKLLSFLLSENPFIIIMILWYYSYLVCNMLAV